MASKKKATYNPISYINASNPGTYTSEYTSRINKARNDLLNFQYNPLQDANYQALARVYAARGNQAAQDTLGDAAALNGGYQTSYAVSAAQQARNQYNQELAALVPDFANQAYNRLQTNYGLLTDADNLAYQQYRDRVADYQWGKGYDTDIYQYLQAQKKSSGGSGGGGRRRSSGGGSYAGSAQSSGLDLSGIYGKAAAALNEDDKKKKTGAIVGGGHSTRMNRNVLMTR